MKKNMDTTVKELEESMSKMLDAPDYQAKIAGDDREDVISCNKSKNGKKEKRSVARMRNHQFRHKQWRRFLNYYPALDVNSVYRLTCHNAIFLGESYYDNETDMYYYRHMHYNLNLYNHLFISKRGDVRVLRGKIEVWRHDMSFVTGKPWVVKNIRKRTNRCIRHMALSEDDSNNWNYYRKRFIESYE